MRKFVRNDDNFRQGGFYQRPRRPENERPNTTDPMELSKWFLGTFSGTKVTRREGESTDGMLRRFKKMVEQSGITRELKRREFHQTTSQKKREKKKKALKRLRKNQKFSDMGDFDPKTLFRPSQEEEGSRSYRPRDVRDQQRPRSSYEERSSLPRH